MHVHAFECKYMCGMEHVWGQRTTFRVGSQLSACLR